MFPLTKGRCQKHPEGEGVVHNYTALCHKCVLPSFFLHIFGFSNYLPPILIIIWSTLPHCWVHKFVTSPNMICQIAIPKLSKPYNFLGELSTSPILDFFNNFFGLTQNFEKSDHTPPFELHSPQKSSIASIPPLFFGKSFVLPHFMLPLLVFHMSNGRASGGRNTQNWQRTKHLIHLWVPLAVTRIQLVL